MPKEKFKWNFYIDESGQHRWNKKSASNGETVGASTEGYVNKQDCIDNAVINGYKGRITIN